MLPIRYLPLIPTTQSNFPIFQGSILFLDPVNIITTILKGRCCYGLVLLDLAKAFVTADHYSLLQKLEHYGN